MTHDDPREWISQDPFRRAPEFDFGTQWTREHDPNTEWAVTYNTGTGELYARTRSGDDIEVLAQFADPQDVADAVPDWGRRSMQSGSLDWIRREALALHTATREFWAGSMLGISAIAPFGGMKQSGLGRQGSTEGIYEFTETQYIATNWWPHRRPTPARLVWVGFVADPRPHPDQTRLRSSSGWHQRILRSAAQRASSFRFGSCSLRNTAPACDSTVLIEMVNRRAISLYA